MSQFSPLARATGPSSFVQTDDMESFVRTQAGLASRANDWVDFSRGMGEEIEAPNRQATEASAMHEMAMRKQYQAWLAYMCAAG